MLGANQLDFISYTGAFKSNYRKGVHKLESILANPTHAAEFAANLGGVSVVLGVPIGREDRNSEALLSLLLNSDIADDAVLTWVHQFYEFTTWDDLMGNSARVQEMMNNPLLWRALGGSKKAVGKGVATLAGLSCVSYADIDAVVASSTAMTAVATSQTAMAAVATSQTAMTAVATSQTAMAAIQKSQIAKDAIAASSMATAKYAAGAAGLNPADYADMTALATSSTAMAAVATSQTAMTAVAASQTAMAAVAASQTAMTAIVASPTAMAAIWKINAAVTAVKNNATAWKTFTGATSAVMGKTVAILADLNPADYADMTAVVSSSTAMAAVAASQTAMTAVAASTTAMTAVEGSNAAVTALGNSPLKVTDSGGYGNTSNKRTVRSGKAFVLSVTFGQTSNTGYYGNLSTFMLGSSPYRATCTATPRAVNRFAKEIVCYGEFQSLNDNVNYSKVVYIPC